MSRAAAFICRLPIYLRFELLLSIASLRNLSQLYENSAAALCAHAPRLTLLHTRCAVGLPQPQFACVDVAPRALRRRARRTAAASPPRRTPPPRRSRALAFQNSPSARSCCRTAMQNAPQAQAVPLLQQLLGFTPHQLMGYFQFLHILYMLSHTYPKTVVGIYCCITVLLLFWPEVQAAVASVADRFRAAEWQPIEVVPYSSPFSEEELKELDADPELEALR